MKRHLLPVLLIVVVSLSLYANTLQNGFVYDDDSTIVNNTFINKLDNLPLLFNKTAYSSRSGEISYRPVVTFTYFVDYALYGLKPWGFHLTNLLLHAINGVLLYIFLTLLLTPYSLSLTPRSSLLTSPALLVSILFVSHPVLTEAVNCISYREDLLAFMFYISTLSLYLVLRQPATNHRPLTTAFLYLLSCLAYLLALLSKEMAVTLPLVILCYEWLYGEGKESLTSRLFFRYFIGYLTITIFYLYLRFYLFHNPEEQIQAWSLGERFLTVPWLVISYLKLSLFPVQLSADYVIKPVASILSPSFILPFTSIISILVVSFISRKGEAVFFGTLFFLTALLPVYNMIPISNPFAERYIYLPMVGFVILAGVAINAMGNLNKKLLSISSLLILCTFAIAIVNRNSAWRDSYSLWTDTLRKMPDSSRAHNNLGNAYDKMGRTEYAVSEYRKALSLSPDYPEAHYNLGIAYKKLGRIEDAVLEYKKALSLDPGHVSAHNNLGNAYAMMGRTEDAITEYREALRLKSDSAEVHYNLGTAYAKMGRTEDAITEYREALSLKPDYPEAHFNLGTAYLEKGIKDKARREFEAVLRINPYHYQAQHFLSYISKLN